MVATLNEAFRAPKVDLSSYTRTTLDSIRNPAFNSNMGDITSQQSNNQNPNQSLALTTYNLNNSMVNPQPNAMVNHQPNLNYDSQSTSTLSEEVNEIKKKYLLDSYNSTDKSLDNETKCDLHIYHILSCFHCRKKMKQILLKNEDDILSIRTNKINERGGSDRESDLESENEYIKKSKKKKDKKNKGDFFLNLIKFLGLDALLKKLSTNSNNILLNYLVLGIFLILIFNFFSSIGTRFKLF